MRDQPGLFADEREPTAAVEAGPRSVNRAQPIAPVYCEHAERGGFAAWERAGVAEALSADAAKAEAGTISEEVLYRCLRGSLYVLTLSELVRVARGIAVLIGESNARLDFVRGAAPKPRCEGVPAG